MAASVLIGASAQSALADTDLINCVATNSQSFSFKLDSDPAYVYESAVYPGTATDLHEMNVAIRSLPVEILVSPIRTRTIVGLSYSFNLPSGIAVKLANITYAPQGFESQLGFGGDAQLPSGQVVGVTCQ